MDVPGVVMGKKKSGSGGGGGDRVRVNPLTGERETVPGPKAGRRRWREPLGSALRTHDLRPPGSRRAVGRGVVEGGDGSAS